MKKLYTLITILALSAITIKTNAQNLQWAKGSGSTLDDQPNHTVVDNHGNTYTVGYFQLTGDFDPGVGVLNLTSAGEKDIFVTKINSAGNIVWAKQLGGVNTDVGYGIAVDTSGNVYTTGSFRGAADFDPSLAIANLNSVGGTNNDIFVSKLDSMGNYVWAERLGGTNYDNANAIALDAAGNIYLTGSFKGTSDFDPGVGYDTLTADSTDVFVCKLNYVGGLVWARSFGGPFDDIAYSIAVDAAGNVITTGQFRGSVDFDPGAGVTTLTSAGGLDAFISKLDASGNFVYAKNLGGPNDDISYSLALDATGNIYTTGFFSGTADLDPSAATATVSALGGNDAFISELDASGNYLMGKALGGGGNDEGHAITLDATGNIYTTGIFQLTADFDPNAGVHTLTSASGNTDVFVSKLNNSGVYQWAAKYEGSDNLNGTGIAVDAAFNVYTTGTFQLTADFDPTAGVVNLTSAGGYDIFNVKLCSAPIAATSITGPASICAGTSNTYSITPIAGATSYTWAFPAGWTGTSTTNTITLTSSTTSGNVTVTGNNACGPGGIVGLAVTVTSIPTVTVNSPTICSGATANLTAGGATSFTWSAGATSTGVNTATASPTSTATYTVTGTAGACSGTAVSTVTVNPTPPTPSITQSFTTLTSSAATGNQWYLNGVLIPGATGSTYTITMNGSYTVVVTSGGCTSAASAPVVMANLAVNELSSNDNITISPNPFTSQTIITFSEEQTNTTIKVIDILGKIIYQATVPKGAKTFTLDFTANISSLPGRSGGAGIYFVQITNENKSITNRKIVLQ
jgi:hypothetical protein